MSTIAEVPTKVKIGYRRADSEPANTTVNNIRCRFESSSDSYTRPEVGLAFGFKKSTPSSPCSETTSPLILRKAEKFLVPESTKSAILSARGYTQKLPKQTSETRQTSETKQDPALSKQPSEVTRVDNVLNKANKALLAQMHTDKDKRIVKPNSLIIPNGTQTKYLPIDKAALICLHNTGIVNSRKQILSSPVGTPATIPSSKANKLKNESLVNKAKSPELSKEHPSKLHLDLISKEKTGKVHLSDDKAKDKRNRHSLPAESLSQSKKPAKTFWKSISHNADICNKHDSILEPGMDYAKLKKEPVVSNTGNTSTTTTTSTTNATDKPKIGSHVASRTAQLTASNLKKVTDTLTETKIQRFNSQTTDDSRSTRTSLSKSPSVSSTCSSISMDSLDIDYINGPFSHKVRRRDTKPPSNIVARRTQLFEKSMDEINSVLEEAEAYNKVKEGGFGTVFKPKDMSIAKPTSPLIKPKVISSVPQLNSPLYPVPKQSSDDSKSFQHSNVKPNAVSINNNNNAKLTNKNASEFKPLKPAIKMDTNKNLITDTNTPSSSTPRAKPLPLIPLTGRKETVASTLTASKPKLQGAPPKPPRTFEHPTLTPTSSNEMTFDPVIIPRQAGDGEENHYHGYERHVSCESPHVYTTVTLPADARPYATTTSIDTRPYTSLTTAGGSGGDDSVAESENAYDTLGRASVASSYEHYDTISQSELDSDVSRPPTLPRRPSNLRHRPLTTAFNHLDIGKNNTAFQNQLQKALSSNSQTIKETSPTSPSPTKTKVGLPFKLKYLLPKARRKADEMRKASSMADLLDEKESHYDAVEVRPTSECVKSSQTLQSPPEVPIDEAGYALPDIKGNKWQTADGVVSRLGEPQQTGKTQPDKSTEKIRLKLNQAFNALRKAGTTIPAPASDGEDDERPPDPEVLEERLKHCTSVKEHAIYASAAQIKGFMTRVYAQLYDYAVIVGLRKNPDSLVYEPYVKYKFPPQINVEQTTVPQFCYPDAHIWHRCTDYKSEAFSFVLTDVTGTRQYGYCRRVLPPDLGNQPRTPEVICVVSPLNATKLYNQVLDEVEKRRMQNSLRAEEFLQAVYGRPLPSPGQSVTIRAMDLEMYESLTNVYEEPESLIFTRSPDSQREGIDYECLLNMLSVSQIIKIFASILLERKIIFIAEKLSILSSCVHAFASLIYPFSWQHTFIPLLPPNLIDVVCAPTPYIVGLLSSNSNLLNSLDDEMEEVMIIDLDNHKFLQRAGDEKMILPKKLHRALVTALDMAKSESQNLRSVMVAEAFLRFFLETAGAFNHFMIHVPGAGRQFQKEEFVCNASNAPSIMVFLQWFTETQMFEVYTTERENDRNVISGTFEERVFEFQSEDHEELFNDNRRFKKFKLFGKNKKK